MRPWPSLRRIAKNLLKSQLGVTRRNMPWKPYKRAVAQVVKALIELQNKKEEELKRAA